MGTNAAIMIEGQVRPLAPSGSWVTNLTAPTNTGPWTVYAYSPPSGDEDAPSLTLLWAQGTPIGVGVQFQLQPGASGGAFDIGAYYGSPVPTGAVEWIGDVGDGDEGPTVANFTSAVFTPPAVSSNITVDMLDATDFGTLSDGTQIECAGLVYTLVVAGSTFDVPGQLVLTNTGLAGSRMNLIG